MFCYLLYEPQKHLLRLLVNIRKASIQCAACEQSSVNHLFMLFQMVFVSLPSYADGFCFFFDG